MADRNEKTSQLSTFSGCEEGDGRWYDLFSRGARDWLRHNEKIRKAVQEKLPELISSSGVLGSDGNRSVKVPVKFLEHFRFRLHESKEGDGAGQGEAKPGDVLAKPTKKGKGGAKGEGGNEDGGYEFVLELKVDDIVDWLWEELKLPNLQTKEGATQEDAYTREGWNKRGARSRLDRRRSMKESIKRRAVNPDGPMFVNEDLRYRQLVMRERPTTQAVVIFAMDVSSSMRDRDRQLAKTFFFWVVQGLRRQYTRIEPVFIAHTVKAWEFDEEEFFQVRGSGGTVASSAFNAAEQIVSERYDPSRFNIYLFYASDGENFRDDHDRAATALTKLASIANYLGYVETPASAERALETETASLFKDLAVTDAETGSYALTSDNTVWDAIRAFFQDHSASKAA